MLGNVSRFWQVFPGKKLSHLASQPSNPVRSPTVTFFPCGPNTGESVYDQQGEFSKLLQLHHNDKLAEYINKLTSSIHDLHMMQKPSQMFR